MTKLIDFSHYSSIHIGPKLEVKIIDKINKENDNYQIIGRANNLLISPDAKNLAILGDEFNYIKMQDDKLYVGCATTSGKLLTYSKKNNIANFEFLAKLPGNLGGLVKMNAGLKQWEIFNYIHSIKTKDGYIPKSDINYCYRNTKIDTIIYEVVFNIEYGYDKQKQLMFTKMRDNQPQDPSAGSCFKNPPNHSAGKLIQDVGLKGFVHNNMAFSSIHANFLVNLGGGTFDDAIFLINLAKQKVKQEFNIILEEEIIII
jgi:UDP-N-acetylmuramate dehydrogenase